MKLRLMFTSLLMVVLLSSLVADPNMWQDQGIPVRQGVNIEWSRAATQFPDGSVIYVWSDTRNGGRDLWAQAVDENGIKWERSLLIDGKDDRQEDPVVISTSDGNVIVAWVDFYYDTIEGGVAAQKISPEGDLLWEQSVALSTADGIQISLNIVPDNDGGAFIIWQDNRTGYVNIYGVHVDADGNNYEGWPQDGLSLAGGSVNQHSHTFWEDGHNGAILAYVSGTGQDSDIYVLRVLENGEIAWSHLLAGGNQEQISVRMSPFGEDAFGFAFIDNRNETRNIFVQALDIDGNFLWDNEIPLFPSSYEQLNPRVTASSDGNFIAVWEDTRNHEGQTIYDLFVQKIDLEGNLLWGSEGVNIVADNFDQRNPRIESDKQGGCFIAWEDAREGRHPNKEVYFQHVTSEGEIVFEENGRAVTQLSRETFSPLLKLSDDNVFIVWGDKRNGSIGIYAQAFTFNGEPVFTGEGEENGIVVYWGLSGNSSEHQTIKSGDDVYVVWADSRYAHLGFQIKVQKIDQDGNHLFTENGKSITLHTGANQEFVRVTPLQGGGLAFAWNEQREDNVLTYVQAINADGEMLWGDYGLRVTTDESPFLYQYDPVISATDNGYLVVWNESNMLDFPIEQNLKAQKIVNGESVWGDDGIVIAWQRYSDPNYPYPEDHVLRTVINDYVLWTFGDGNSAEMFVKKLDSDGSPMEGWDEYGNLIYSFTPGRVSSPRAVMTSEGLLVAWEDTREGPSGIYAQLISPEGEMLWEENGLMIANYNNDQAIINLVYDDGFVYISWRDARVSPGAQDVAIQKIDLSGNIHWEDPAPFVVTNELEQDNPTMTKVGNQILVFWENNFGEMGAEIRGQLLNADTSVKYWDVNGMEISNADKRQTNAKAVPFDDRYAFVVWHDGRSSGKEEIVGLYAQRVDARFLSIDESIVTPITRHKLHNNFPNPFNPETKIAFDLVKGDVVSLQVYNLKGQLVKTLIDSEHLENGRHQIMWNGRDNNDRAVGSGVYFYRLQAPASSETRKMLLLK